MDECGGGGGGGYGGEWMSVVVGVGMGVSG